MLVRRVQPGDADGLQRFLKGLSPRSVYLRFCTGGANLNAAVHGFTEVTGERVGVVACDLQREIVAHAEYLLIPPGRAEVAVVVADQLQGRGLARKMIDWLATDAARQGIESFVASVLPENAPMLALFTRAFDATVTESPMMCEVSFPIPQAIAERRAA
jgi:ribosomal protein S18 acetylase RimI-like enzyme